MKQNVGFIYFILWCAIWN